MFFARMGLPPPPLALRIGGMGRGVDWEEGGGGEVYPGARVMMLSTYTALFSSNLFNRALPSRQNSKTEPPLTPLGRNFLFRVQIRILSPRKKQAALDPTPKYDKSPVT